MEEPKRFSSVFNTLLLKSGINEWISLELEDNGIVLRNVIAVRPVRTEYSLTKKGTELGRSLKVLEEWADKSL